jgi:predicted GIY-YIG superfamily endonuclease
MGFFISMYYVYLIKSLHYPNQRYVGRTICIVDRVQKHNEGGSIHTAKYRPWELIMYLSFKNEAAAIAFEKYLKSGSGNAFANKRLWV